MDDLRQLKLGQMLAQRCERRAVIVRRIVG
jgi:hypothetical protein